MGHLATRLHQHIHPVHILIGFYSIISRTENFGIIFGACPLTVRAISLSLEISPFGQIHSIGISSYRIARIITVIWNLGFAYSSFLCSNQDDSVSTARTINSGRRSILQNLHRFYNIGIDINICPIGYSVHNNQRSIRSIQWPVTANREWQSRTCLTTWFSHI